MTFSPVGHIRLVVYCRLQLAKFYEETNISSYCVRPPLEELALQLSGLEFLLERSSLSWVFYVFHWPGMKIIL